MDKRVMPKTQTGCIPFQVPESITDLETGESVDDSIVKDFLNIVLAEACRFSNTYKKEIVKILEDEDNRTKAPVGTAWKGGLKYDYGQLDKKYKQRSRIGRIIIHRVMCDWTSYFENSADDKEEPSFTVLKASLGAVDRQMAVIEYDKNKRTVSLEWQCLDKHLLFVFKIPEFTLSYDILSFSLPTVHVMNDKVVFDLPFEERLSYKALNTKKMIFAGYDLGRVKPYVLTIVNRFGNRIAVYEASSRLVELNNKREAKIKKKKNIHVIIEKQGKFGIDVSEKYKDELEQLTYEIGNLGKEIARLTGHEIAEHCDHHEVVCCFGEDLSFVNEWAGRSSRWVHGEQQAWCIRLLRRVSCAHMFVNAVGTSQQCAKCGGEIKHDGNKRLSTCINGKCMFTEDRDRMASWVIAKRGINAFKKYLSKIIF